MLGAFGPAGERRAAGPRLPSYSPSPDSFRHVFRQREFGRHFLGFLLAEGSAIAVPALIGFLPAAVRRFRLRFRTVPPIMFPAARTMPVRTPAISLFSLPFFAPRYFGRPNTPGPPASPRGAFSPPFVIPVPRGFAEAVRDSPEAAAHRGGASRSRFLRRTYFPLAFTGLVAAWMFSSVPAGNDFLFPESLFADGIQQYPCRRSSSPSVSRWSPTGRYGGRLPR